MAKKLLKVAHVPDAHTPWHDPKAVECVKNVFKAEAPFDQLIIHGDFWICLFIGSINLFKPSVYSI